MEGSEGGGLVVRGRVEIDMRQPFSSVKEAISLFGEKVLAGEIYANKLKEMQTTKGGTEGRRQMKVGTKVKAEVEETKQRLEEVEKTKEEGNLMAFYLNSLKQELEQTKKELQQLKSTTNNRELLTSEKPEIEELKFIENSNKVEVKTQTDVTDDDHDEFEFQKKRSVKFASPPLLTKVIVGQDENNGDLSPSAEKKIKRKKPLIPLIGTLFLKKKGASAGGHKTGSSKP
ncbi:hypothetical protein M9H77_05310 [Catharanthus roseus]|uniref:Uncharacterized protein n=1 Tax=Catharanthus roseus TaxID=4058 RepID=A0ACC0CGJ3_CATRO|nr:hypothetical protein M9H77_05310 [Catharanthus roseus]